MTSDPFDDSLMFRFKSKDDDGDASESKVGDPRMTRLPPVILTYLRGKDAVDFMMMFS